MMRLSMNRKRILCDEAGDVESSYILVDVCVLGIDVLWMDVEI